MVWEYWKASNGQSEGKMVSLSTSYKPFYSNEKPLSM
jgi:hypothetical protein